MSRISKGMIAKDVKGVAPRVAIGWKVGMKTFGTKDYFSFTAKDISSTGIFLKVDDPRAQAPFQNKTLLEIVFYPDGEFIKEEFMATAVVVRTIEGESVDKFKEEFGVRIVDAPEAFSSALNEALRAA